MPAPIAAEASAWERGLARALPFVAALLFPALLVAGSGRWNDVLVDFGRELYLPWRIAEGDVLYRDLAHLNGPLSPYVNATLFRLFGVGLATLTAANASVVALLALLVACLLRRIGGGLAAGVALVVFLPLFACGHFTGLGNYNLLSPYSHELTHGLLCSFAALACLCGGAGEPGRGRLAAAGTLLGLVFLTKPELFLAAAAGIGAYLVLAPSAAGASPRVRLRRLALVAGASLIAPLIAVGALSSAMPFDEALRGALGAWPALSGGGVVELAFYRRAMGIDDAAGNLGRMLASFGRVLLVLAPAAAIDLALRRRAALGSPAAALAFVATTGMLWMLELDESAWLSAGRHLPLTSALAFAASLVALVRARSSEERRLWAARASFALFALALLAKIALAVLLAHYGFALALPAALVFVALVIEWIPALLRQRGGSGQVFRAAALALLGCTLWSYWRISEASFARKTVTVGQGADAFQATPVRGAAVNAALRAIEARFPLDATLLVLPEGVMIDYLARRRSPTRFHTFMPPELLLCGEQELLAALRASPPDAVLLVHKDTSEYGFPLFGIDYGRDLMRWVREAYPRSELLAGDPPLQPGSSFGIALLEPGR